ncbi:MAG: glycosyltransferase family 2 protein [Candidatus Omnitrophota bacterium]
MSQITIIIPVLNEEENISELIKGIKTVSSGDDEILVIDDGSEDNTAKIVKELNVRVISHPYNMGNGAAVKTGIRIAKGEILVLLDGDSQHNPADIPRLLEHIDKYDMVVGARTDDSSTSFQRKLANKIYNLFASYVSSFKIEDLTSGFRVVKKEVALKFLYLLPNTFSYPTTITLAFLKSGRGIKYIPIKTRLRKGKSKISPFKDGVKFLLIITKIATLFSPFRIFLPVSLFFFALGAGYYGYTYFNFHRFTNMSALLIMTSIIIFMMGLVSEQIAQLRLDRTENI